MPWVKIDDHFDEHPKVAAVGPLGMALQLAGLCYSNRNLTDGFVPRSVARNLVDFEGLAYVSPTNDVGFGTGDDVTAKQVIEQLCIVGMWDEVLGGYQIHNYGKYQRSREEVEASRLAEHAGKAAGGRTRAAGAKRDRGKFTKGQVDTRKTSSQPAALSAVEPGDPQQPSQQPTSPVPVPEPPWGEGSGTGTGGGSRGEDASPSPQAAASPSLVASGASSAAEQPNNGQPPTDQQRRDIRAALERRRQDQDAEQVTEP